LIQIIQIENGTPAPALTRGKAAPQTKPPGIYYPGDAEPVVANLPLRRQS